MLTPIKVIPCLYNIVRAGLAFAEQASPSVASKVSKVQTLIFLTDLGATCESAWEVFHVLKEKHRNDLYATYEESDRVKKHNCFISYIALSSAGLLAISCLFVKGLSHLSAPKIDLNTMLKSVSSLSKNMTAAWTKPLMHELTQMLFCTRIVLSLTQTAFSSNRLLHFFNASLQLLTLSKISKLRWIQFDKSFPDPFKTMQCKTRSGETKDAFQATVKELQATFLVKISTDHLAAGFQAPDGKPYLSSVIDSVCNYSHTLFQDSSWSRGWSSSLGNFFVTENYTSRASPKEGWPAFVAWTALFFRVRPGLPALHYNVILKEQIPHLISLTAKLLHQGQIFTMGLFGQFQTDYYRWVGVNIIPSLQKPKH